MANTRRRTFEQQDPNKGNFQAYKNLRSSKNQKGPDFTGSITIPGSDEERGVSLWARRSKDTGNLILSGPVTPSRDNQWENLGKQYRPHPDTGMKFVNMGDDKKFGVRADHMVIFTSPDREQTEGKKAPPRMFGYYNPGGDHPIMVVSAFEHADRNNNIMLLGPVEVYDPDKSYDQKNEHQQQAQQQDDDRFEDHFSDLTEPVPAHMLPKKENARDRESNNGPQR